MLVALRGLNRIRTAVDGFAYRWLSHSPIRPYSRKTIVLSLQSANIETFFQSTKYFTTIFFAPSHLLYLLSHSRYWDIEHLTILGHSASRYFVPLLI